MVKKIYFITGIIFEIFVARAYIKQKDQYTKTEILVGGIIDIVLWPIVLLKNILDWRR